MEEKTNSHHPLSFSVQESFMLKVLHRAEQLFFRKILPLFGKETKQHVIIDLKSRNNFNYDISDYFHHMYGYQTLCNVGFSDDEKHAYVIMKAVDELPYSIVYSMQDIFTRGFYRYYWSNMLHTYVYKATNEKIYTCLERCKINLMLKGEIDPLYEDI